MNFFLLLLLLRFLSFSVFRIYLRSPSPKWVAFAARPCYPSAWLFICFERTFSFQVVYFIGAKWGYTAWCERSKVRLPSRNDSGFRNLCGATILFFCPKNGERVVRHYIHNVLTVTCAAADTDLRPNTWSARKIYSCVIIMLLYADCGVSHCVRARACQRVWIIVIVICWWCVNKDHKCK